MCRPLGYQVFVFVGEAFAGTLSPVPMDSRTDGAEVDVWLDAADYVRARFDRYTPADPLCCPSRTSVVAYEVRRALRGAVVVPARVTTKAQRP